MARPRQISNEQIIATTRACVLEHGSAVSLELVAERLGVTAPALHKRFGSRQELLIRALQPAPNPRWVEQLEQGPSAAPLVEQLERMFAEMTEYFRDAIPCMAALRDSGVPHKEMPDRTKAQARAREALNSWLIAAHARGLVRREALETAATAMLGAVWSYTFMAYLNMRSSSARSQRLYVQELAQLFARALAPDAPRVRARRREASA